MIKKPTYQEIEILAPTPGFPAGRITSINLAKLLGLSPRSIYNKHHLGLLPSSYKIGTTRFFDYQEVINWIDGSKYGKCLTKKS